jgi:hypothetical protein
MGFFQKIGQGISGMFTGERRQARVDKRRAARQKRIETRQGAKSQRAEIDAVGASERAAIAAQAGFDPMAESSRSGKLGGFLEKAGGFIGNLFGGGQASAPSAGEIPASDEKEGTNKLLLFGGLALAGIVALFAFKKK